MIFYLDRHVKVYDTTDYSVVASLDYPSAITSIGISVSKKLQMDYLQ